MNSASNHHPAVAGDGAALRPQRRYNPIPGEGEDGVYTQSWFPICLSDELAVGKLVSREFLGGRVVAYRDSDGKAHVLSAYCPHLGADIGVGAVIDDNLRCPFHHWQFNSHGQCIKTAIGDPAPRAARLFKFPTIERFGLVLAFNGEAPLFDFPEIFPYADDELQMLTFRGNVIDCDGWVFSANTPDMQHLKVLHGVTFDHGDPHDMVEWHDWGFAYSFSGVTEGQKGTADLAWRLGIHGSNLFYQMGTHQGRWYAAFTAFSCIRPNKSEVFAMIATPKGDGTPEGDAAADAFLQEMAVFEKKVLDEDTPVLNTIHYKPGTLTKSDKTLAKFLDYIRRYPRAHPSADFIN